MKWIIFQLAVLVLFLSGCATGGESSGSETTRRTNSPTGALMRGELTPDEYLEALREANEEARKDEQFQMDKEPTRAYNTKTGRVEYVPEGTSQKWNEETQRWEFTPIEY